MMKKLILAAIIVLACSAGLGVASAGAANCTISSYLVYQPSGAGNLVLHGVASSCTDVEAVRFYESNTGTTDASVGGFHPVPFTQANPHETGPNTDFGFATQWCWWAGGVHTLVTQVTVQLKRAATHTWGSKTTKASSPFAFAC